MVVVFYFRQEAFLIAQSINQWVIWKKFQWENAVKSSVILCLHYASYKSVAQTQFKVYFGWWQLRSKPLIKASLLLYPASGISLYQLLMLILCLCPYHHSPTLPEVSLLLLRCRQAAFLSQLLMNLNLTGDSFPGHFQSFLPF